MLMLVVPAAAMSPEEIDSAIERGLSADSIDEVPPLLIVGRKTLSASDRGVASEPEYTFMIRGCRQWIPNSAFHRKMTGQSIDRKRVDEGCLGQDQMLRVAVLGRGDAGLQPITALSLQVDGETVDPTSTENFEAFGQGTGTALFDGEKVRRGKSVMIVASLAARRRLELAVPGAILEEVFPSAGQEGAIVAMPHYALRIPPDRGWRVEKPGDPTHLVLDVVRLTKKKADTPTGPIFAEIKLMRNRIIDEGRRKKTARENADHVRDMEKSTMLEAGVRRGLYDLRDVKTGEEEIGGKKFYFMDYTTQTSTDRQWSSLYLLFPEEKDNEAFLMILQSEIAPVEVDSFEPSKRELREILATLSLY